VGHALAQAAGARLRDMEFVQFHPTAIDVRTAPLPLATEALRGAGARLIDGDGAHIMAHHKDADLAPRDDVARGVHRARRATGGAFLDTRAALGDGVAAAFPGVFRICMAHGIDPRTQPIPVTPAQHYHMGGIAADLTGAAGVPGLFALGECAHTRAHGANRLASNSLLEGAVMGLAAGTALRSDPKPHIGAPGHTIMIGNALPKAAMTALRSAMDAHGGVERDGVGLNKLLDVIDALEENHGPAAALVTARAVAEAALARRESLGAHCRRDAGEDGPHQCLAEAHAA